MPSCFPADVNAASDTESNADFGVDSDTDLPTRWLNEANLDALLTQGFFVLDDACPAALLYALQQESVQLQDQFQQAKIAQGGLNQTIRGDSTRWLGADDAAGGRYLYLLEKLGHHLNQYLYSGIRRVEAHYATYAAGDFYKLHRDNPQGAATSHSATTAPSLLTGQSVQQARVISSVLYLNARWQPEWHGELHLQDSQQHWHMILPLANRLVIFQSNLLHEVRPATHERRSIAGWLRRDGAMF